MILMLTENARQKGESRFFDTGGAPRRNNVTPSVSVSPFSDNISFYVLSSSGITRFLVIVLFYREQRLV
ncbi:hypothetical protein WH47_04256 [Habropoda laboriosa]|uniref:Uncharacterized protein n=1 Tax=Habropoda laboriosa TaxID=597456 RepID=A0A0L7QVE4_9HYME|nr:hypothetical protein WH47_04256 [Habropoda laboriosa]